MAGFEDWEEVLLDDDAVSTMMALESSSVIDDLMNVGEPDSVTLGLAVDRRGNLARRFEEMTELPQVQSSVYEPPVIRPSLKAQGVAAQFRGQANLTQPDPVPAPPPVVEAPVIAPTAPYSSDGVLDLAALEVSDLGSVFDPPSGQGGRGAGEQGRKSEGQSTYAEPAPQTSSVPASLIQAAKEFAAQKQAERAAAPVAPVAPVVAPAPQPPSPPAPLPNTAANQKLRRNFDATALLDAQKKLSSLLQLGDIPLGVLLGRAAERSSAAVPGVRFIALAELTDAGLEPRYGIGSHDSLRQVLTGERRLDFVPSLLVADLSELELDEIELPTPVLSLMLTRLAPNPDKPDQIRGTLSLNGPVSALQGANFLKAVVALLESPLSLM